MNKKLNIGIIGTRGIPNHYGGFEQFAEYLSVGLVERGHKVAVYNSDKHPYKEKDYKGVQIIHQKDPEDKLGTAGQFIYDLNCIRDSRKRNFDIILNLGYTSSAIWMRLFPKSAIVITNMDGLEWKRTKFNKYVQKFLQFSEKIAIKRSDYWIADSKAIQSYLAETYQVESKYIAYGANIFDQPDSNVIKEFGVEIGKYSLLIARMEPENNIEMILEGVAQSNYPHPFLVIGNIHNKFGLYLQEKFSEQTKIRFVGPIYTMEKLNNLRYFSDYYFHGHSVGGTNPSLLEAMASKGLIVAHSNPFNKSVLQKDAFYFESINEVKEILENDTLQNREQKKDNNISKIKNEFSWDSIIQEYENYFLAVKK